MLNFILAVAAIGLLYVVWKNASDDNAILMVLPVIPGTWLLIRLGCGFAVGVIIALAVSFAVMAWGTNRNEKRPSSSASRRNTDASRAQVDVDELLQEISAMPPSERKELAEALKKSETAARTPPPKPAPLAHIDPSYLAGQILLQSELFRPITDFSMPMGFHVGKYVYLEERFGPLYDNEVYRKCRFIRLNSERTALIVYDYHCKNSGADIEEYELWGECGRISKDERRNRVVISLSRDFIHYRLSWQLGKVQKYSLYWKDYRISQPTPRDKEVAFIDLSSSDKKIFDIDTNEAIARYTGDPYGAGVVFIELITRRHGWYTTYLNESPDSPDSLSYVARVSSKYMDFLCYETKGNWCKKK